MSWFFNKIWLISHKLVFRNWNVINIYFTDILFFIGKSSKMDFRLNKEMGFNFCSPKSIIDNQLGPSSKCERRIVNPDLNSSFVKKCPKIRLLNFICLVIFKHLLYFKSKKPSTLRSFIWSLCFDVCFWQK